VRFALAYLVARLGVWMIGLAGWIEFSGARTYIADTVKSARNRNGG